MTDRIFAGVLCYNRKEIAIRCLRALLAQTRPVDRLVIFDNGSTDGTKEYLKGLGLLSLENVSFVRIEKNVGPSAGFNALFQHCYLAGCDFLWVMDDDVVPDPDALEEFVSAYEFLVSPYQFSTPNNVGFLACCLRTPDGLPNNVPDIDDRHASPPQWAQLLGQGLVKLQWATLCGTFIPRSTMDQFGFPCGDFYYGGEDIDYSFRVARDRPSYLVGNSSAVHLRAVSGIFNILSETDPKRLPFYYYFYRNQFYLRRTYLGRYALARFLIKAIADACRALPRGKMGRAQSATVLRGLAAGVFFTPLRQGQPMVPKLDLDAARQIRQRYAAGETGKVLAYKYGVSKSTISMVVKQRIWRDDGGVNIPQRPPARSFYDERDRA
jgi:dTDP-4-dehydrorhamnose reductase